MDLFIYLTIALAIVFDFLNGFHDAANSIATVVATRVLSPRIAVLWAAFFNLIAFLFFNLTVANTIGSGLIMPHVINPQLICSALCGAIFWNLFTWYHGLPSSSSHALIGGLMGAAVVQGGLGVLNWSTITKIIASIFFSPLLGLVIGLCFIFLIMRLCSRARPQAVNRLFRSLQLVSCSLISLGHGGNDAQKTMGIITALLVSSGKLEHFIVPFWLIISCSGVMALGTLFGGWRIVQTMGSRITKLKAVHGFCAETAAAVTLFLATHFGIPVSSTHTITGSIMGVGSLMRVTAVRWRVAHSIMWAWLVTIPAAAVVAAGFRFLIKLGYA